MITPEQADPHTPTPDPTPDTTTDTTTGQPPAAGVRLALAPPGRLYLTEDPRASMPAFLVRRISAAFAAGPGPGVLHLGAVEVHIDLPPTLAYFRDLGRLFLTTLCELPDLARAAEGAVPLPGAELNALLLRAPPMTGLEYLRREVLDALWGDLNHAVQDAIARGGGDVLAYLQGLHPLWGTIGRVCLSLTENPDSARAPFGFVATYTTRGGDRRRVQHVPLAQALKDYTREGNRPRLLSLLSPVQRAAASSEVVRELLASGELYEMLTWTPRQAYRFLKDVPALEAAGLMVRVPDFWRSRRRPKAVVTIGSESPGLLTAEAVCDFSVNLALDGEVLSEEERREILGRTAGLFLLRGRWVEIDGPALSEVLGYWESATRQAALQGINFLEAMRMIAGARISEPRGSGAKGSEGPERPDGVDGWSQVVPGDWLGRLLGELRDPARLAAADPGEALKAALRTYQKEGVAWLRALWRLGLGGCLADDMGLGKTIQVLALLLLIQQDQEGGQAEGPRRPHLIVVPASLMANWEAEMARFAPSLRALFAHPSVLTKEEIARLGPAAYEAYDVVVVSYAGVRRVPGLAETEWGLLVLDEAQAVKNPAAQTTQAARALRCRARLLLTGTPVENRLQDLWSLYEFVSPGLLGSARRFALFSQGLRKQGDFTPLRELVRPQLLRRLKTDRRIAPDLPERTDLRAYCTLSHKQAALYQQAVDGLSKGLARMEPGIRRRGLVLAYLQRLKQICNHPAQYLGSGPFVPAESGKFLRLRELCLPIVERQERVLVFTQFQSMTAPLADYLAQIFGAQGLVLDGATKVAQRGALVAAFQEEGEGAPPFFVLSIKAGGVGLNLTAAQHVIHFDRWWNPAVEEQAVGRAHRIGQRRAVMAHKFICRGTIEERIDQMIDEKKVLSAEVLRGGAEVLLSEMGDDELLKLVALDERSALGAW
jgi:non-specific serine/threonine protein kinase